ncbi:helix-turn-helix domain-containing protein [Cohnella soli]|uniref:Helix-turn-helix domain-containing protein n=1 Tax=Cohnella soli TaxID=425005 RepID=A0ABW0HVD2_9BACL
MKRLFTHVGILQIFSALLLVIATMFVSNYYVYQNSISSIYEKVAKNNALGVQSTVQSFDNTFQTMARLINSIHGLPYNTLTEDDGRIDMERVYAMQDQLAGMISSIDYIEEAIVFYDGLDLAVTSKGTSNFDYLFNKKYRHPMYNASYWRTYSSNKHAFKMFPASEYRMTTQTGDTTRMNLMVAVDSNKIRLSNKNVILLINEAAYLKAINMKFMIPGASLIVLDEDRNLIMSTDPQLDLVEVLNDVYFKKDASGSVTTENYEYHFYKSDFNGYLYIDKAPYQFQNIDSVAKANQNIMLITIVSALILSVFLSIYLHRPVKKIIRQLGGGTRRGNDFRKILSGIVKLQTENETYRNEQKFADSEVRRGIFLQAVDPFMNAEALDDPMHRYFAEFFRSKQFVLVLLHVMSVAEETDSEKVLSTDTLTDHLQAGLRLELPNVNVFYDKDMHFIAVVGIDRGPERDMLLKRLKVLLPQWERGELAGYSVKANVSKLYASETVNCKSAYRDVSSGLMLRGVDESSGVLDTVNIMQEGKRYFPLEKVAKLSNHVIKGNWKGCGEIIAELIKRNADLGVRHHEFSQMAKSLFYQMIRQVGESGKELPELETAFMRKVDAAHDRQAIEKALLDVVDRLAAQSRPEPVSKLNPAFISQYIELHYMENLYLDQIAEVTGTSSKYFSNYFKKTFGVNYVEYLNKVRLTYARELLKETSLTVAEIGERTGYLNASTFTTTFKKYYGISPSEYRKQEAN